MMKYIKEETTICNPINIIFYIGLALFIIFLAVINTYSDNPNDYKQQHTTVIAAKNQIDIFNEARPQGKLRSIISKTQALTWGFLIIGIIILVIFLCLWTIRITINEIRIRFKLLRKFGAFRYNSLAKINL